MDKQFTVYLKPHTVFEKFRWWLWGKLPVLYVDEVRIGQPGFMELVDKENNRCWTEWHYNVQSFTCNFGFSQAVERIITEKIENEMKMFLPDMSEPKQNMTNNDQVIPSADYQ